MDDRIITYFVGVDLGQAHDYTAISIIERTEGRQGFDQWGHAVDVMLKEQERFYDVVHLERLRHQPYPVVVAHIATCLAAIPRQGKGRDRYPAAVTLVVDATGVGRPIVDLLTEAGLDPVPISITGGDAVTRDGAYWRVPKRDIVTATQVFQQRRRLRVAPGLKDAATLTDEMQNFKYKLTATAHDVYGVWREGKHDDLVLAVALPLWYAEHGYSPGWTREDFLAVSSRLAV